MDRQTNRQTDRQINRQIDRLTETYFLHCAHSRLVVTV